MSQRIMTFCDLHSARDEDVAGQPYDLAARVVGGRFRFFTIDLCEDCAKPLAELIDEVAQMGREFQGDPVEAVRARAPKSAPKVAALDAKTCPVCGSEHASRDAMRNHLRTQHGSSVSRATGIDRTRADPIACDVCGKGFTKSQGLASHRRIAHPDVPAKTTAEIRAEVRADG